MGLENDVLIGELKHLRCFGRGDLQDSNRHEGSEGAGVGEIDVIRDKD